MKGTRREGEAMAGEKRGILQSPDGENGPRAFLFIERGAGVTPGEGG